MNIQIPVGTFDWWPWLFEKFVFSKDLKKISFKDPGTVLLFLYLCGDVGAFTGDVKPLISELIKLPATDIDVGGGDGEFGTCWIPTGGNL